jgi:fatty-acid desaturase
VGTRPFSIGDDSRNNLSVALLTFGEGWHNNHHAHSTAARHGLAWYEIDIWRGIHAIFGAREINQTGQPGPSVPGMMEEVGPQRA